VTDQPLYTEFGFSDDEWGLLVGLPQAVLTAASAAESDGTRRTLAESHAGMETISAERTSASVLVSAVAQEVVSRVGDPEVGEELPMIEPDDPQAMIADVLDRARTVSLLLAKIADEVVGAASTGGLLGLGGDVVSDNERRFRDHLSQVLTD
jgi:hypothetical protein